MFTNEEYAESVGAKKRTEGYTRLLARMESYGDDKWWLSEDPKERAYRQMKEPVQILDWIQYGHDLSILLGRTPLPYELILDEFRQEVERAWIYNVGCTSEQEAKERLATNVRKLLDRAISQASPETLQKAMHLAGEICPCPKCTARRNAEYIIKKKR